MRQFDFYEFAGIITPGAVGLLGVCLIHPRLEGILLNKELSIGDLGLVLILAYAAGHIAQAAGNCLEAIYWRTWGGMPSDWVRTAKHMLLDDSQRDIIPLRMHSALDLHEAPRYEALDDKGWYALTRSAYAVVAKAGLNTRSDIFNASYGLNRGLSAVFLVLAILLFCKDWHLWPQVIILLGLFILAGFRAHRFGIHYARELFVQFLFVTANRDGETGRTSAGV